MRAFHPPRCLDAKKISHSPVCDSVFLCLSGQKSDDMSSRPTKILKISAFRDFFVTEPKCQKGAKNRVKTRFLRRISILCSSYGGSDGNLNRNVRFRQCVAFRRTVAHSFRRLLIRDTLFVSCGGVGSIFSSIPPSNKRTDAMRRFSCCLCHSHNPDIFGKIAWRG